MDQKSKVFEIFKAYFALKIGATPKMNSYFAVKYFHCCWYFEDDSHEKKYRQTVAHWCLMESGGKTQPILN